MYVHNIQHFALHPDDQPLTQPPTTTATSSTSSWDSIHVFEAETPSLNKPTHYKLTSTIILSLSTSSDSLGSVSLAGNLTRQYEADVMAKDDSAHVVNIGRLVEDMEGKMRNMLQEVYFGKTKDVVGDLRSKFIFICFPGLRICLSSGSKP